MRRPPSEDAAMSVRIGKRDFFCRRHHAPTFAVAKVVEVLEFGGCGETIQHKLHDLDGVLKLL